MKYRVVLTAMLMSLALEAQIPNFKPPTPLFEAILRNDAAATGKLLNGGADPNEAKFFGSNALLIAVVQSNDQIVRVMLERGADVNASCTGMGPRR